MAELKTKKTGASVDDFLNGIDDKSRQADARAVCSLMKRITGQQPTMWGTSMVGFGELHYKYATGHEGDIFRVGFSPRKAALTLYLSYGFEDFKDLMGKLGKYKTGKACLYVKKLSDVDERVLTELIKRGYKNPGLPEA